MLAVEDSRLVVVTGVDSVVDLRGALARPPATSVVGQIITQETAKLKP